MIDLDLEVKMCIRISDLLNARLEQGEPVAFLELETYLKQQLNSVRSDILNGAGDVIRLQIDNAGPHNVVYDPNHPSATDFS